MHQPYKRTPDNSGKLRAERNSLAQGMEHQLIVKKQTVSPENIHISNIIQEWTDHIYLRIANVLKSKLCQKLKPSLKNLIWTVMSIFYYFTAIILNKKKCALPRIAGLTSGLTLKDGVYQLLQPLYYLWK